MDRKVACTFTLSISRIKVIDDLLETVTLEELRSRLGLRPEELITVDYRGQTEATYNELRKMIGAPSTVANDDLLDWALKTKGRIGSASAFVYYNAQSRRTQQKISKTTPINRSRIIELLLTAGLERLSNGESGVPSVDTNGNAGEGRDKSSVKKAGGPASLPTIHRAAGRRA
jgi:hypothetical protein